MKREEGFNPFEVVVEITPDRTLVATIDSTLDGETSWEVFEDEIDLLYEAVSRVRRAMKTIAMTGYNDVPVRSHPDTGTEQPDSEPPADDALALLRLVASGPQPQQQHELFLPSPSDDDEDSLDAEEG